MTDADVDGAHIRTLLLTLFFRHFRALVDQGNIYIAQPPLYRYQVGKNVQYVYDEAGLDLLKEQTAKEQKKSGVKTTKKATKPTKVNEAENGENLPEEEQTGGRKASIQRYKGLGEMNPNQLWETTMDPEKRLLKRVTIHDAEQADVLFSTLMGDEVQPRKHFIQTHAKTVKNLDV